MADTIAISAGSGTTVSTEEVTTLNGGAVSAQHLQRVATGVVTADGVAKDLLLGRNSDANSLSAALSTEDVALVGSLTETAPGTDTASSGLNGRLQRIAQNITTLLNRSKSSTGTHANVASSASNVTLLASNASRLGATIYNDSTAILYVKLGATASTTSYAAQMATLSYYEVPFGYTGIIDGIWASANGNARVTELT